MITAKTPITEKMDYYKELGLNDNEIRLLTTPLSKLNKELGAQAMKALDKMTDLVRKRNEEYEKNKKPQKGFSAPNVHTYETQ